LAEIKVIEAFRAPRRGIFYAMTLGGIDTATARLFAVSRVTTVQQARRVSPPPPGRTPADIDRKMTW